MMLIIATNIDDSLHTLFTPRRRLLLPDIIADISLAADYAYCHYAIAAITPLRLLHYATDIY